MKVIRKQKKLIIVTLLIAMMFNVFYSNPLSISAASYQLKVSFIDIGQGDSFLLESNGKTLLIDGGPVESGSTLVSYLRSRGIQKLDYIISTHPHLDHSGGLYDVINHFDVGTMYMTTAYYNHATYFKLLSAISLKGIKTVSPTAGTYFNLGSAKVHFLSPTRPVTEYSGLNDTSIVVKVVNGENSFLFTGDAETIAENEMIAKGYDLKSDVLKVGHHSALTSTSLPFLNAVDPSISVISCGKQHQSGFPRITTLNKLSYTDIYRTDLSGTIVFDSDGKEIKTTTKPYSIAEATAKKPYQNLNNLTATGSLGGINLLNLEDEQNFNTTFRSSFKITFNANYGVSSLDKIQYAYVSIKDTFNPNTVQWSTMTGNTLTVNEDFYGSIYVKYRNKFGQEEIRMTNGFSLDQGPPTNCTVTSNLLGMQLLDTNGSNAIVLRAKNKVTLNFAADFGVNSDGLIEYMVVAQGEKYSPSGEWTRGRALTVDGEFTGRVYVKFTNKAGNKTIMKTQGFKITKN